MIMFMRLQKYSPFDLYIWPPSYREPLDIGCSIPPSIRMLKDRIDLMHKALPEGKTVFSP
jgi:hypothetical protein